MAKGVLSSGVLVLVLGVSKSGKEKSQADCLGTRRWSQGTRIKSLVFAFAFSEFYYMNFTFLQVVLFKFINTIHPPLVFVLLVYRSYIWYQSKDGNGIPFIAIQRRTFYTTSTII